MYDATSIVRRSVANGQPVIVVAANHRVNVRLLPPSRPNQADQCEQSFGFLPGKEVANDPTASVNAGSSSFCVRSIPSLTWKERRTPGSATGSRVGSG